MSIHVNTAYKSLNKFGEELCGDKVEIVRVPGATIAVLADGLGSGVKANILSTLTSKIISTMLREGAAIEECVETITSTLPVCCVRKLAYCTFSVLYIKDDGEGYLVEFDNPFCIFIRNGKELKLPCEYKELSGKGVYETRFTVQPGDVLCVVSDGVIYAGVGETLNFGWTRENVAAWMAKTAVHEKSAPRLALSLSQTIDDLYLQKPGDDSTVMIASVTDDRVVNLLSGPPKSKEDDGRMLGDFMRSPGAKVVCGGSSANMVGRILGRKVNTTLEYDDPMIPPTATIEGIDLVTEGVLTMSRTVEILREYVDSSPDAYYFKKLDAPNGAAELAKVILEDCTCLRLFVGTAINPAHQNPNLPSDLSIKGKLIDEIASLAKRLGKSVEKYTY